MKKHTLKKGDRVRVRGYAKRIFTMECDWFNDIVEITDVSKELVEFIYIEVVYKIARRNVTHVIVPRKKREKFRCRVHVYDGDTLIAHRISDNNCSPSSGYRCIPMVETKEKSE